MQATAKRQRVAAGGRSKTRKEKKGAMTVEDELVEHLRDRSATRESFGTNLMMVHSVNNEIMDGVTPSVETLRDERPEGLARVVAGFFDLQAGKRDEFDRTLFQSGDVTRRAPIPTASETENMYQSMARTVDFSLTALPTQFVLISPIVIREDEKIVEFVENFEPMVAPAVPLLGTFESQTSTVQVRTAHTQRRGLSVKGEMHTMSTKNGKEQYLNSLAQLANSVSLTTSMSVVSALANVGCPAFEKYVDGSANAQRLYSLMDDYQLRPWNLAKSADNPLSSIAAMGEMWVRSMGGRADTLLVDPMVIALSNTTPAATNFYTAGYAGPQRLLNSIMEVASAGAADRVYPVDSFVKNEDGVRVNPLDNVVSISEYVVMGENREQLNPKKYQSDLMSVGMFTEHEDRGYMFKLHEMIDQSHRFSEEGAPISLGNLENHLWSEEEIKSDLLTTRDVNGQLGPTVFLANVSTKHTPTKTRLRMGESMAARIFRSDPRAEELLASVRAAIRIMENATYADAKPIFEQILDVNREKQNSNGRPAGQNSNRPSLVVQEFKADPSSGAMKLPTEVEDLRVGLPPGYQSLAGIREITRTYQNNKVATTTGNGIFRLASKAMLENLVEFRDLFERVTAECKMLLPGSPVTDEAYAATWWQRADAADVLFDNIIGNRSLPLWAGGNGVQENAVKALIKNTFATLSNSLQALSEDLSKAGIGVTGEVNVTSKLENMSAAATGITNGDHDLDNNGLFPEENKIVADFAMYNFVLHAENVDSDKENYIKDVLKIFSLGDKDFENTKDTDALVEQMDKIAKTIANIGHRKSKKSEASAANMFSKQIKDFQVELAQARENQAKGSVALSYSDMARTTLLASKKMTNSISGLVRRGTQDLSWTLSNPDNPDLVATLETVAQVADRNQDAGGGAPNQNAGGANVERPQVLDFLARVKAHLNGEAGLGAGEAMAGVEEEDDADWSAEMEEGMDEGDLFGTSAVGDDLAGIVQNREMTVEEHPFMGNYDDYLEAYRMLGAESAKESFAKLSKANNGSWGAAMAVALNFSRVTAQQLHAFCDQDIIFPFNFIVARASARYVTSSAIMVQAEGGAVQTFMNPGKFAIANDGKTRSHELNYDFNVATMVMNEKNVTTVPNVLVKHALSGTGVAPVEVREVESQEDGTRMGEGDIVVFMVGASETSSTMPNPLNLSGSSFDYKQDLHVNVAAGEIHKEDYSSAPFYRSFWSLNRGAAYMGEIRPWGSGAPQPARTLLSYSAPRWTRRTSDDNPTLVPSGNRSHWGEDFSRAGAAKNRVGNASF